MPSGLAFSFSKNTAANAVEHPNTIVIAAVSRVDGSPPRLMLTGRKGFLRYPRVVSRLLDETPS
jgi:hypothetical protein